MATTEAHLIMLKVEMATLRRMLELTPVSSSSTAVVQPTIASISHATPSPPSTSILTPTIQCRICGEPLPGPGGAYDHHLKANIKNGTMSRRKSRFACKAEAKLIDKNSTKRTVAAKNKFKSTTTAATSAPSSAGTSLPFPATAVQCGYQNPK